jgi:hypothetical protein
LFRLLMTVLLLLIPISIQAEQKNIHFKTVPDFLHNEWKIVFGPNNKGAIEPSKGSLLTGPNMVMFSKKESNYSGDYTKLEIGEAIQYNIEHEESPSGYATIFQLNSKKGDVVLYPGSDFWEVCIRIDNAAPYAMYLAIPSNRMETLKRNGLYESSLQIYRNLLEKRYRKAAQHRELCA